MNRLSSLEAYCNHRNVHGRRYTDTGTNLDFAFDARLGNSIVYSQSVAPSQIARITAKALTNVADIPGYPTRKLLLGGPDTRTNAAILLPTWRPIHHELGEGWCCVN